MSTSKEKAIAGKAAIAEGGPPAGGIAAPAELPAAAATSGIALLLRVLVFFLGVPIALMFLLRLLLP